LAALIRIEDLGLAVFRQRLLDCLDAEGGVGRDREFPGENFPAELFEPGGKRHLRLESRALGSGAVVSSWSLLFLASCRSQAEFPLIPAVQISPANSTPLRIGI
jgi:hypothetical protein